MLGRATLTIETSSRVMNPAARTTASAIQRFGSGRYSSRGGVWRGAAPAATEPGSSTPGSPVSNPGVCPGNADDAPDPVDMSAPCHRARAVAPVPTPVGTRDRLAPGPSRSARAGPGATNPGGPAVHTDTGPDARTDVSAWRVSACAPPDSEAVPPAGRRSRGRGQRPHQSGRGLRPDEPPDDLAAPVEDEGGRQSADAVAVADLAVAVAQVAERPVVSRDERLCALAPVVPVDADERRPGPQPSGQTRQLRGLAAARRAPARPEVDHRRPPVQRRQAGARRYEHLRRQLGSGGPRATVGRAADGLGGDQRGRRRGGAEHVRRRAAWVHRAASKGTSCAIQAGLKLAGYSAVVLPLPLMPYTNAEWPTCSRSSGLACTWTPHAFHTGASVLRVPIRYSMRPVISCALRNALTVLGVSPLGSTDTARI